MAPKTAKCLRQFCLCLTVGGLCYVQFALDFVVRQLSPEQHPRCREIVVHAAARTPAIPDFDADLGILAPLPPTASLSRYKGTAFDAEAPPFSLFRAEHVIVLGCTGTLLVMSCPSPDIADCL